MRYLALLRGVNVGGNNQISMKELKEALADEGFREPESYINSGNILFSRDSGDEQEQKDRCEAVIRDCFGLDIKVVVISARRYLEAMAHAPHWWGLDKESKHNAIYVIPPSTAPEVMAQVGEPREDYEQVASHGNVIFWSAPLKTYSRTRWSKVLGTAAYHNITIRNANTARRLAEKLNGE